MSNTNNSNTPERKNTEEQDLGRPVGQQSESNSQSQTQPSSEQENQQHTQAAPNAVAVAPIIPWYASPWFWSIFLFLGILALLAWLFWLQWQAHVLQSSKDEAYILAQENRNKELEAHLTRLQQFLAYDPCILKEMLGKDGILLSLPVAKGGQPVAPIPSGTPLQIPSHVIPPVPSPPTPVVSAPAVPTPPPSVVPNTSGQTGTVLDAPSPPPAPMGGTVHQGSSLPSGQSSQSKQPTQEGQPLQPAQPSIAGQPNASGQAGQILPNAQQGQKVPAQSPLFPPTKAEAPPPPPLPSSAPASPPPAPTSQAPIHFAKTASLVALKQNSGIASDYLNILGKE